MATCTFRVGTADTSATPNTSGAFTPALGDLLVVFFVVSASSDPAPTMTSSIGGFTFSLALFTNYNTNSFAIYVFVSDQFVTSATSQTVTGDCPADSGTGSNILVFSVAGMSVAGATAVRQVAEQENQAAAGTPAPAFASAALFGNPVLGCVGNLSNPAGLTPPTDWTEPAGGDIGYNTPTTGAEVVFRNSGFTGTTVTWGGTSATAFGSQIVELDARPRIPLVQPVDQILVPPRVVPY